MKSVIFGKIFGLFIGHLVTQSHHIHVEEVTSFNLRGGTLKSVKN